MLHHWNYEDDISFEMLRDEYIRSVDKCEMASLNEIHNVHEDDLLLSAEEFCKKYRLKGSEI